MSKQNQTSENKSDRKSQPKVKPSVVEELVDNLSSLAQLPGGAIIAAGDGTIENQATLLNNPQLQTVQRRALATQIGRVQGNAHLQRVVASIKANRPTGQAIQRDMSEEAEEPVEPVSPVSGQGEPEHLYAFSLTLQGRTDANFDGGTFRTENVQTSRGNECADCEGNNCVHVTGTLVSDFTVTTTVTLPQVSDFPDLTVCQRERVQNAIDTVLAPHEQEHVDAFNTYNGTVRTPFDLNICRAEFNGRIRDMHDQIATERQDTAQAASDALDPFNFEVDLDCEDEESESEAGE